MEDQSDSRTSSGDSEILQNSPTNRMIITDKIYTSKWEAEDEYASLIRAIINCHWLLQTSRHLEILPCDMYEVVKVGNRKWKINATPEHLAATQKYYKIV